MDKELARRAWKKQRTLVVIRGTFRTALELPNGKSGAQGLTERRTKSEDRLKVSVETRKNRCIHGDASSGMHRVRNALTRFRCSQLDACPFHHQASRKGACSRQVSLHLVLLQSPSLADDAVLACPDVLVGESHEDSHKDIRSMGQEQCEYDADIVASTWSPCAWKAVDIVVQGSAQVDLECKKVSKRQPMVDIVDMYMSVNVMHGRNRFDCFL